MLSRLSIREIVLIERLDIDFSAGLSVLTGETGAGKSILLDALSLALGARGDGSLVRHGAVQGQVTAVFDVPLNHPARAILADNALDDDGDIILRRVQNADGRTRVFVNDQPSSVTLMRDIGRALVEIHGQHDERALVAAAAHRDLLDSFGGHVGEARATADAWRRWRGAEQESARHRAKVEAAAREADFLRASVAERSKRDPQPGEETDLADMRASMMRVEKAASEIKDAQDVLSGANSPLPQLASLLRRLQRKAADMPDLLDDVVKALDEALISLDAAQSGVDAALRATEYDPQRLERAEERLFALRAAARKHHVRVDDLARLRDTMSADLADLDAGEERLHVLEAQAAAARNAYDLGAMRLSELRRSAAAALEAAVMTELPALRLDRAAFILEMASAADTRCLAVQSVSPCGGQTVSGCS
jgi:DNA repair protein RecN (Recombination protein N)